MSVDRRVHLASTNLTEGCGLSKLAGRWAAGIVGLVIAGLLSGPAGAAMLYVASTGNDSNPGTAALPFRTVQKGVNIAQPGDTVRIMPGAYPETVSTVRSGTSDSPIIIDGQGGAVITQLLFKHAHIHAQNLTVTGVTNAYSRLVYFDHYAHHCILSNSVLDVAGAYKVFGIQWRLPSSGPFGNVETASRVLIVSNVICNLNAYTFISLGGDSNVVQGNILRDGPQSDFFNVFGRNHLITGNVCSNMPAGSGNHPDFIQTWGNNGYASRGHIIENNVVSDIASGQLTQLEGNTLPDTRDWTFRNNLFIRIALQGSGTIPDVRFYNNVFYKCNMVNGGHAISYGIRWYENFSIPPVSPYYALTSVAIPSGNILNDATEPRDRRARYIVKRGSIIYNGTTYTAGQYFFGTNVTTYSKVDAVTEVWRVIPNYADGNVLINNVFLDCGFPSAKEKGWYSLDTGLINVLADYNYVAKDNYGAVKVDAQHRPVGAANGWSNFDWWEPHGLNGGDPGFVDVVSVNFRLREESLLNARGLALPAVPLDFDGKIRPNPPSIGAFEFAPGYSLKPPVSLRILSATP